ncbi:AAA family ATPase [Ruminococcus albus]|uniref:AAA domain (Dynein-related subfamily) n=1 Tax=Ruminococcus albus TaxID=1264 RepID=A0A1I1LVE3_RUMAL|nr:AAA family ATPase [Ruminococcus albus]SFC77061.1 AAA domain (dynein-related subfamily) [Ruminococcus albus]
MAKSRIDAVMQAVKAALKKDDKYVPLSKYLAVVKREPEKNVFGSEETLYELVDSIITSRSEKKPIEMMNDAEDIYRTVLPLGEATKDYGFANAVFLKIFENNGIYHSGLFTKELYLCFNDKQIYIETMCTIADIPTAEKNIYYINTFGCELRQYYSDEKSFASSLISGVMKLCSAHDKEAECERLIGYAQMACGIYDITEDRIARSEMMLKNSEETLEGARHTLDLTEDRLDSFKNFVEQNEKTIKDLTLSETEKLTREAKNAEFKLREAFDAFLNEEHDSIVFEKDKLVREVIDSADSKIRELKMLAAGIKDNTAAELFRINTEANKAIDRASSMLNNGELKNILTEVNKSSDLVNRIIRVDEFSKNFDTEKAEAEAAAAAVAPVQVTAGVRPTIVQINAQRCTEPADMTPNFFFDETYPFKDRFEKLMEKKQEDIAKNNALYHEHFDDIITAVIEDSNPYMIGPSGCGKTFLVGQIARLLGLEYLDIGYINEEYDLLGFQTADGGYNYPAFYRAYKYGGIVFCDEFDNGNIRAAVKLNSFMSNSKDASYCFPNGERVMRHPNFRIIAAGNTAGDGADRNYSTREKIEESLMQRFTAIYVDYDNRLEKDILRDHPQWFEFAAVFRNATTAWSKENQTAAPGIFTTRDATSIKKYLDHQSYDVEAIVRYEFIETKDNEYLAFLQREMAKYYNGNGRISSGIFSVFNKIVFEIRNGDTRR